MAERSHGVVTREQLRKAAISDDEIKHRLACGSLFRVHRGVYRVGHRAPSTEARYLAAVKRVASGRRFVGGQRLTCGG